MESHLVLLPGAGSEAIEAWRELAGRAALPNPFCEADFVVPAARHLGTQRLTLLVVRDGAGWTARAPVVRGWRVKGVPVPHDRSEDRSAVERFLILEASGSKSRVGTAIGSTPAQAAFFREMCSAFSDQGRLRVMSLEAGGTLLAMKCSLLAGDGVFYIKAAYDERYARFSVGGQLELEAIRGFLGRSCLKGSIRVPIQTTT